MVFFYTTVLACVPCGLTEVEATPSAKKWELTLLVQGNKLTNQWLVTQELLLLLLHGHCRMNADWSVYCLTREVWNSERMWGWMGLYHLPGGILDHLCLSGPSIRCLGGGCLSCGQQNGETSGNCRGRALNDDGRHLGELELRACRCATLAIWES